MDRGRKRKATTGASPEVDNSATKRQRTTVTQETPETTTKVGLQLVEQLKSAKDKTGRLIADLFLELPDKKELPDYYRTIKLPISIQLVEDKLKRHGYANLSLVESDVKRMVANAKQYNDDASSVYQDAERIRKLLSNFMTKHNPAYKDASYQALPTPIPDAGDEATGSSAPATRDHSEQPRKTTITLKASRDRKSSVAAQDDSDPTDFGGKSFQQAQEHIIDGLIAHMDQDVDIFQPFVSLPPRSLVDYYKVIKKPVSLTAVRKRCRGQHGREAATMQSDFKTWDAFEDEVSYIWRNAREYNEDGSDMFNLSVELEELFKERLALAKDQVGEPAQPKIKLSAPRPKPVLHLGARGSPAPRSTPAEDKEAAVNGNDESAVVSRSNSVVPVSATPAATVAANEQKADASSPSATVKMEKSMPASPSLATARAQSIGNDAKQSPRPTTSMPPPPSVRGPSGSPHPLSLFQPPPVPAYIPPPPTFVDNYARTKPLAEALLPSVLITTHPQLALPKPTRLNIPASPHFTQQSVTTALPPAHYYLSIIPNVSQRLIAARQYKLFVTVNSTRLMGRTQDMLGGDANRKQVYDATLVTGVNRIEVEVVAVTGKNGALEVEKLSVFANLLRGA